MRPRYLNNSQKHNLWGICAGAAHVRVVVTFWTFSCFIILLEYRTYAGLITIAYFCEYVGLWLE